MMSDTKRSSFKPVRTLYTVLPMILIQLLLLLQLRGTALAKNTIALPGCAESCGGIPIPYPFGIGRNCSLSEEFNVNCEISYFNQNNPNPFLVANSDVEILNISLALGQVRTKNVISSQCYDKNSHIAYRSHWPDLPLRPDRPAFQLNTEKNKFTVIGCNTLAFLRLDSHSNYSVGCLSMCDSLDTLINYGSCSGIGCCQTTIPKDAHRFDGDFDPLYTNSKVYNFSKCSYVMVVEEAEFKFKTTYVTSEELSNATLPMVFDWAIGNMTCEEVQTNKSSYACISKNSVCFNRVRGRGYICNCSDGYQGNPYLHGGCQDIDECANQNACTKPGKCHNLQGGHRCSCPSGWLTNHNNPRECNLNIALVIGTAAGVVALLFLGVVIYVLLERRKLSKVKEKYFQQHGGWILLEKIKLNQGFGFTIFTKQQVEQATNNFDSSNILGQGGHGTVYRGTLRDETVAIKKCKIVNERKKKEFGKEMLILSQINHKSIVKILGCCLEVEVPMLVYEFIPNGTLYHYINYKKQGSHISLETRLRIAHESAEALAYLHTSASPPIIHRDVKSANILLDQNYTAKVSDFGASILVPTDEAQFVTLVQGTYGYLDPEYMQSGQLTDKSDVYSFGVVLLEILTSKPVVGFDAPEEKRNLSSYFLSSMEENKMQELLDDEIKHEDDMQLIKAVAELAKECLSMKGEDRPMMKEVAEELLRVSKLKQHPWGQEYNPIETDTLLSERSQPDIEIEHTSNYFKVDKEAEHSISKNH